MSPDDLKAWRKKSGYSQSQLAAVLGVHVMTVSKWERGVREIPPFLHLALECMDKKGDGKTKRAKTKERRLKK